MVKIRFSGELQGRTLWVTGNKVAGYIFNNLYDTFAIPSLPQAIYQMRDGDFSSIAGPSANLRWGGPELESGMYYSVICHDAGPLDSRQQITSRLAKHPEMVIPFFSELDLGPEIMNLCSRWKSGKASPSQVGPVYSDVPALVLTGEYDPTTPSYWGEHAAKTLGKSYFLMFPGQGHAQLDRPCGKKIAANFVDNPNVEPATACLR